MSQDHKIKKMAEMLSSDPDAIEWQREWNNAVMGLENVLKNEKRND